MNKLTKGILIGSVATILTAGVVASSTTLIWNNVLTNEAKVEVSKSLVTKQNELQASFTTQGYTLENPNVKLNPYGNSPLTALIMFQTPNQTTVKVTIKGKDPHSTFTHDFTSDTNHFLPIYGLYPNAENEVTIQAGDQTKVVKIKTQPLPENFILPTNIQHDKSKLASDENTLYMFTPAAVGYTCAYDINGDVRWYLAQVAPWSPARLNNGHLLIGTDRRVNPPYYVTGLYEMDLLGKVYHEYTIDGGYHHDFDELPSGNLLVASNDFNSGEGTVEDLVVEIDKDTGKVVKEFNLLNILPKTQGKHPDKPLQDGKVDKVWTSYDWFHNNSVWYDNKTKSITLSGRHQDAVINISYETGELNWIIGDSTNWGEDMQKYFFTPVGEGEFEWQWCQHAAMITPEGDVFILDNGNDKTKDPNGTFVEPEDSYTRGVLYEINTKDMTIKQKWQYGKQRGSEFYSPYISDVDYLANNHYIVHSGGIVNVDGHPSNKPAGLTGGNVKLSSTTVELLNDEVIFEITLPTNYYRVEKINAYTNSDNGYRIKEGRRLGGFKSTEISKERFGLFSASKIDDEYKSHNIKINKEEDRLSITGTFKKDTPVEVILYKNLRSKVYNVRVAKRPYTALCIDIFTPEETAKGINVTKNINDEGLDGEYSLFIKINDKIYNTEKSVKF